MTKEEKQKAIAALKLSAPVKAMTQEEFKDYIQTLNKIIDWLEQPETVTEFADRCRECGKRNTLDKIRAEVERIGGDDEKAFCKNLNESYKQGLKDALKVIDKYKDRKVRNKYDSKRLTRSIKWLS